ncbi:MAG: NfeD family protein [Muribaculum sp.]|nr:NfeD family protein [Muribaculum sp.]
MMSEMMVVWLVVLIITIAIEVGTLGLTSIWFGGGALAALLLAAFSLPVWLQILIFLMVSFLLLMFTRPIAVKYFNKDRVRTNVESMVGRQAIVISEIDNLQGIGQVTVGGQEWSARSEDEKTKMAVGTVVVVVAVSGVKLIVREDPQMQDIRDQSRQTQESQSV